MTRSTIERMVPWFATAILAAALVTGWLLSVGTGVLVMAGGLIVIFLVIGYMAIDSLLAENVDLGTVADIQESELLDLEREKTVILQSIRDLENERDLGKISPDDFVSLDAFFRKRAIGVMKKIERDLSSWRKRAEGLVADRLQHVADKVARGGVRAPQAEVALAAPEVTAPAVPSVRTCYGCEAPVDEDSNFCKKCGAQVTCTCGVPLDAESAFCKKCGARVGRHA